MTIIWCMVPIWQTECIVILDSFWHFFHNNNPKNQNFEKMKTDPGDIIIFHMCTIYDNHMMYMKHDRQNVLLFLTVFCSFTPLTTWKIKILKTLKKTPGDIIILHMCTTNDNHMMYGSLDTECHRHNSLSFWTIFCPFTPPPPHPLTPLKTQKIKILKKWKRHLEISSFYTCVPKLMIRWCTVPEIWCTMGEQMEKVTYRGGCPT